MVEIHLKSNACVILKKAKIFKNLQDYFGPMCTFGILALFFMGLIIRNLILLIKICMNSCFSSDSLIKATSWDSRPLKWDSWIFSKEAWLLLIWVKEGLLLESLKLCLHQPFLIRVQMMKNKTEIALKWSNLWIEAGGKVFHLKTTLDWQCEEQGLKQSQAKRGRRPSEAANLFWTAINLATTLSPLLEKKFTLEISQSDWEMRVLLFFNFCHQLCLPS